MTRPSKRRPIRTSPRVIAYLRVSTEQQAESGAGIDGQRAAISSDLSRRGWTDIEWVADPAWSAKDLDRPEMQAALAKLDSGLADVLIAKDLARVSRSVRDFAGLQDRAREHGWRLILLDVGVDTATPAGEMVANVIASAAQYERRVIGQRTKDALAAKRAAGVRLGRPSVLPEAVVRRIVDERASGAGLRVIAEGLTEDGVPTARGGAKWSTSSVQAVLAGQDAARVVES